MLYYARTLLEAFVSLWARAAQFSFPKKYSWRWKLEMLTGRYEPETTRLFRHIVKPGMIVIDVGAHIGYFTRLAAKLAGRNGRVFAFEPDEENAVLLAQNTRRYGTVRIEKSAVGEKNGRVPFYHVRGSTGCHSTIAQVDAEPSEVPVITLDSFLSSAGAERIDIIKMDIEGGELSALRGMEKILYSKPQLIVEYNPAALVRGGNAPEALFEHLALRGFTLHAITRNGLMPLSAPFAHAINPYLENDSTNVYCIAV